MGKDRFQELQAKVRTDENSMETTTALHVDESFLHDFFYQIDLLRNIIKEIAELIHQIQHFQTIIFTSQLEMTTREVLKTILNDIKRIRNGLKIKIAEMKQTQLPTLNKRTRTILTIQNLHINMLKNDFVNAMKLHNEAMISYHKQCRQWIIHRFEINQNQDEIDEILDHNNSIISVIEIMNGKQQNKYSFKDMEVYYQDISEIEKNMKQLHELLFHNFPHIIISEDYLHDSIEFHIWDRMIEYQH